MPDREYVDTPMKRSVREISRHWQPIYGNQETPPFREMHHAAHNYDTTSFADTERYYAMPPKAPTGHGLHHPNEDRETSHFMGAFLDSINPELATLYRGGAPNEHQDRVVNHTHREYNTTDHLGRLKSGSMVYSGGVRHPIPTNDRAPEIDTRSGRSSEILIR